MKKTICLIFIISLIFTYGCNDNIENDIGREYKLNIAVEYTNHAASYYCAEAIKLFEQEELEIRNKNTYVSGVNLAAAFSQGGFDVGYMCVVPAISAHANAGIPIKIIAGTHKSGYGLVVNKEKINKLSDFEKDDIIISNGRKGTTTDFLFMILINKENLDSKKVLNNTVRMNATKQLMALKNGQVDAIFVPEHFATLAATFQGMEMLVKSDDIWNDMQGSVLVVTDKLIEEHPEIVKKLKKINAKSISFMNENPERVAEIISQALNINQTIAKEETKNPEADIQVTPLIAAESMKNLRVTEDVEAEEIQKIIDEMYSFGYIKETFKAEEIMISN